MILVLGTATRGPSHLPLSADKWYMFGNREHTAVNLASAGSCSITRSLYRFVQYRKQAFWESTLKPTADRDYEYRLKGFPIVPGSFTITLNGAYLTNVVGDPGVGEYWLDEPSGLLRLATAPVTVVARYYGNTGELTEVVPIQATVDSGVIAWDGTPELAGESWLEEVPDPGDDLVSVQSRANFDLTNVQLSRCDISSPASVQLTAVAGTVDLTADPGPEGNLWKACHDADALYILRAPGYYPRRLVLPLTEDAENYLNTSYYPDYESVLISYPSFVREYTDDVALSASTMYSYAGGTTCTTIWTDVLTTHGGHDWVIVPLGMTDENAALQYISDSWNIGCWPILVMQGEVTADNLYLAAISGTVTYSDGGSGSPLAAFAGALSKSPPYYLPQVLSGTPRGTTAGLIYPVESIRYGWMVSSVPMTDGDLYLNHHLWIQELTASVRSAVGKYVGQMLADPMVVGTDPDLVAVMATAGAEYSIELSEGVVLIDMKVKPPGMASRILVHVRAAD